MESDKLGNKAKIVTGLALISAVSIGLFMWWSLSTPEKKKKKNRRQSMEVSTEHVETIQDDPISVNKISDIPSDEKVERRHILCNTDRSKKTKESFKLKLNKVEHEINEEKIETGSQENREINQISDQDKVFNLLSKINNEIKHFETGQNAPIKILSSGNITPNENFVFNEPITKLSAIDIIPENNLKLSAIEIAPENNICYVQPALDITIKTHSKSVSIKELSFLLESNVEIKDTQQSEFTEKSYKACLKPQKKVSKALTSFKSHDVNLSLTLNESLVSGIEYNTEDAITQWKFVKRLFLHNVNGIIGGKKYDLTRQKLNVEKQASIEQDVQVYSMRLIFYIIKIFVMECTSDFSKIVNNHRLERREIWKQKVTNAYFDHYKTIIFEQLDEIDQWLEKNLQKVVLSFDLSLETFQNSVDFWKNEIKDFHIITDNIVENLRQNVSKSIDLDKQVTIDYLNDMLYYQIDNFPCYLKEYMTNDTDDTLKVNIVQFWLIDLMQNQFGIEEEDWNKLPGLEQSGDYIEANRILTELIKKIIY